MNNLIIIYKIKGNKNLDDSVGTYNYMSPELYEGDKIEKSADFWALGVIFFKLITGEYPFIINGSDDQYSVIFIKLGFLYEPF
jgi:serine/threonine protein kinase